MTDRTEATKVVVSDLKLPYCSIQNPACGACGSETSHDGDSFCCEPCGLDYGDGSETPSLLEEL